MINGYEETLQQILLEQDRTGWRMLVGCIMLNCTTRAQVDAVRDELFDRWQNADMLSRADERELEDVIRPLGLYRRRARTLRKFSDWWEQHLGVHDLSDRIIAMDPPGVGEYARDSWIVFYQGIVPAWPVQDKVLRQVVQQYGGASGVIWT